MRSKMRVFEKPAERVICILSSGNLSLTQATLALIDEDLILGADDPELETIMNRQTLYETVRYVGSKVRAIEKRDRVALEADGFDFNINLIVRGATRRSRARGASNLPAGQQYPCDDRLPFLADR